MWIVAREIDVKCYHIKLKTIRNSDFLNILI